jgi:peroxiredoxin family protein
VAKPGDAKALGGRVYACVGSMALLNIARDDLTAEVDEATGTVSFLEEAKDDQLIFV